MFDSVDAAWSPASCALQAAVIVAGRSALVRIQSLRLAGLGQRRDLLKRGGKVFETDSMGCLSTGCAHLRWTRVTTNFKGLHVMYHRNERGPSEYHPTKSRQRLLTDLEPHPPPLVSSHPAHSVLRESHRWRATDDVQSGEAELQQTLALVEGLSRRVQESGCRRTGTGPTLSPVA